MRRSRCFKKLDLHAFDRLKKSMEAADFSDTPEVNKRHGLMSIPRAPGPHPILAYIHGGNAGLSYEELATILDDMQSEFVVRAAKYPGEALKGRADDNPSLGESKACINDADELLGMHNCIAREIYRHHEQKILSPEVSKALDAQKIHLEYPNREEIVASFDQVFAKVKPFGGAIASYPRNILVGSLRGGLVANLALARIGAAFASTKTVRRLKKPIHF